MARKPSAVEEREKDLIAWYKWEFLRRNPEYRKDYELFSKEFGAWFLEHGAWYDRRAAELPDHEIYYIVGVSLGANAIQIP